MSDKLPQRPLGDYNNRYPCAALGKIQGYLVRIDLHNWAYWCPCGFAGEGAPTEPRAISWFTAHVSRGNANMAGPPITVSRERFRSLVDYGELTGA